MTGTNLIVTNNFKHVDVAVYTELYGIILYIVVGDEKIPGNSRRQTQTAQRYPMTTSGMQPDLSL